MQAAARLHAGRGVAALLRAKRELLHAAQGAVAQAPQPLAQPPQQPTDGSRGPDTGVLPLLELSAAGAPVFRTASEDWGGPPAHLCAAIQASCTGKGAARAQPGHGFKTFCCVRRLLLSASCRRPLC